MTSKGKEIKTIQYNLNKEFVKMKIHSMDDKMEMEFDSLESGSAYFREILKIEEKGAYIEYIFPRLDIPKQQLIITLIHDLLPESKKDSLLGVYLQAFLDDYEITYNELAKCIYAYIQYSIDWKEQNCSDHEKNEDLIDVQGILSKLQRFLKGNKSSEENKYLKLVSGFFSVSPDVLITGKGKRYSVDLEKLKKIVMREQMDIDLFLDKHFKINFNEYIENPDDSEIKLFQKYIHYNASVFAEIVSEQFNIDIEEILIAEECWIELEKFPIKRYYDKLTDKSKNIVRNVLFYLNIKEIYV